MRAVIQRVTQAEVRVAETVISRIGAGLLVLLGIETADTQEDVEWLSGKIVQLRIFNDGDGVMNVSVRDTGGEILAVSQFTLHAATRKGNRPSYLKAAKPETALLLYRQMLRQLETDLGKSIGAGEFQADMKVMLVNNGPVTIIIDSKNRE